MSREETLVKFFEELTKIFWDRQEKMTPKQFTEVSLSFGLVKEEQYDKDKHSDIKDAGEGDTVWVSVL